jgi:FO synthase
MTMDTSKRELLEIAQWPLDKLIASAAQVRDAGHGGVVTFSPKVFIPLTELCRDVCHYCTYAKTPRRTAGAYLEPEQVLDIARRGRQAGCREALFTLGDKPELRYRTAREALVRLGHDSTLGYLAAMARLVLDETGLLPHLNAGILTEEDYRHFRALAPSMGIMLETSSLRLSERGGPHFGSPDKLPSVRLDSIRAAGRARVPFTSGILIGIGETRLERLDSLLALRDLHREFGHIQEVIVQNFVPKPGTKMAAATPPSREELLWTVALARHVFGPEMSIQVPPNLNANAPEELIHAGINDWGGVSPVTPDHVNPESPWPRLRKLADLTESAGKTLVPRLTVYPAYVRAREAWIDGGLLGRVLRHADSDGYARDDFRPGEWAVGAGVAPPTETPLDGVRHPLRLRSDLAGLLRDAAAGRTLTEAEIVRLFRARAAEVDAVCSAADALRREVVGDTVSYAVNRNINYTNVCLYKCSFCAFSKGKATENLRGAPYVVDLEEIARRTSEAWNRGATEVCLQGGIHPRFTGRTYLEICRTAKQAAPDMHIHAFSPLEIAHGARTLEMPVHRFLEQLMNAGLGTLPGTAAEILDDGIRRLICPDKLNSREWLETVAAAHSVGLRTTSTIMFGHVEELQHWARHLLALRALQQQTGGITELVPLPYVHMEAPMHRRGLSRPGPTWREAVLMHAVARLVLHPLIPNIQVSWVKLGAAGAVRCLDAGANDLGGTLMNESISRAAGASHGQEMPPEAMVQLIAGMGRHPVQRDTMYRPVSLERTIASYRAPPLASVRNRHAREFALAGEKAGSRDS